jgi:hypothetical protein
MKVKKDIQNAFDKKTQTDAKSNHYLIAFTKTHELYIIDAVTGKTYLEK